VSGRGRRGSALGILIIAASFAAAGYIWIRYAVSGQKAQIARLEEIAGRLKAESVPVKFMILSREGGNVKARLRLYDLADAEVSVVEGIWPGSTLYVDMLLVPLSAEAAKAGSAGSSWLAFPYRVFTDATSPASGTTLFDAYDGDGFPRVLEGIEWTGAERAAIISAFKSARELAEAGEPATASQKGAFGSAVHEAATLSRLEDGVVYKLVCRVKGGVEIMED
jgi:hypothetical protein